MLDTPNLGGLHLSLSFDLLLGTGAAAAGFSLVYGPIPYPEPFGETGTGAITDSNTQ